MQMSNSIAALAAALSAAQGAIEAASKGAVNPYFKSKYADLNALREVIREPLAANGLSITQFARTISNSERVEVETMLMHSSGEYLRDTLVLPVGRKYDKEGEPFPVDVQSIGSAITYARRYALSSILSLAADDDDGNAAVGSAPPARTPTILMRVGREAAEKGEADLRSWWNNLHENDRTLISPGDRKILKGIAATADYHRANPDTQQENER
ncbi:MAG: ERF superfamily protein [Alphaproteobacteria bacterium]|nr:ERF superfamily protein [Alphaproteobacteria bacterium]